MSLPLRAVLLLWLVCVADGWALTAATPARYTNDYFTGRTELSNARFVVAFDSNTSATRENGEPNHVGLVGGKSIWWSWTAPTNGPVTITTLGSSFDTLLAVYTGTTLSNLTEVASNDQDPFGGDTSAVSFQATAGTQYRIAVDGYFAASGDIRLNIAATQPPIVAITNLPSVTNMFTGLPLIIAASATDPDGVIRYVKFIANGVTIGIVSNAPYTMVWTNVNGGSNGIVAQALDSSEVRRNSELVTVYARPSNDDYTNAIALSGRQVATNGNNAGASIESTDPVYIRTSPDGEFGISYDVHSVWYSWQCPESGIVRISTQGGEIPAIVAVTDGNITYNYGTRYALAQPLPTPAGGDTNDFYFYGLAGTNYHIFVDGKFEPTPQYYSPIGDYSYALVITKAGNFRLEIAMEPPPPPPVNDAFAGRIPIPNTNTLVSGSNISATRELGEPLVGGLEPAHSVWWTWTAPASGVVDMDLSQSDFPTVITVYQGGSLSTLSPVANSKYSRSGNFISFNSRAGVTYQISVDGENGTAGNIKLFSTQRAVSTGPTNDRFTNAIMLAGSQLDIGGNNVGATSEPRESEHGSNVAVKSVWYKWVPSVSGRATLDIYGTGGFYGGEPVLEVYTGTNLTNLVAAGAVDAYLGEPLILQVTGGKTYYFVVDGYGGAEGYFNFNLRLVPPPVNDNFSNRIFLTGSSLSLSGTTAGASSEMNEPDHRGHAPTRSVWWSWSPPYNGRAVISTTLGYLGVYTGTNLLSLQALSNNWYSGDVAFFALSNHLYQIAVDSDYEYDFNVAISLQKQPLNDNFAQRIPLSGTYATLTGGNTGASREPGEPAHVEPPSEYSVWWTWTAPATGVVRLENGSTDFDAIAAVYRGTSISNLTPIVSRRLPASLSFNARTGEVYQIAVDGSGYSFVPTGNIGLVLSMDPAPAPPPNDRFQNRALLMGLQVRTNGSNIGATAEALEPVHANSPANKSVWWNWTAPFAGEATISVTNAFFSHILAAYGGTNLVNLVPLTSTNGFGSSEILLSVLPGQVIQIVVDGVGGETGYYTLEVSLVPHPFNDKFANRAPLLGTNVFLSGTTVGATREVDDPFYYSYAFYGWGRRSVWWTWRATNDGVVLLTAYNSEAPVVFGAFEGSSLATLTNVALGRTYDGFGQVAFRVRQNQTLQLVVDAYGETSGAFDLGLDFRSPPLNDRFQDRLTLSGTNAQTQGTTFAATLDVPPESYALSGGNVWYAWTAPKDGPVRINTTGGQLHVYRGTVLTNLALISNDYNSYTSATFLAQSGQSYAIEVFSDWENLDPFIVSVGVFDWPPNDNFANRVAITGTNVQVTGYNVEATLEPNEPGADAMTNSVWWTWTAPGTGRVVIDTTGSMFPVTVQVYVGNSLSTLRRVSLSYDGSFACTAGQTFQISMGGLASQYSYYAVWGDIAFRLSFASLSGGPPGNDLFSNRTLLNGSNLIVSGSNVGATIEAGEPPHSPYVNGNGSVWWSWTAPSTGTFAVDVTGFGSFYKAVYTNSTLAALGLVGSGLTGDPVIFDAVQGRVYQIAVDSELGTWGDFTLIITNALPQPARPGNDKLSEAFELSGFRNFVTGSNVGATHESVDPNPPFGPFLCFGCGGASVWWKWVTPADGLVQVSCPASVLMLVYEGDRCSTWKQVGGNGTEFYDTSSYPPRDRLVFSNQFSFAAHQGKTYYFMVDKNGGEPSAFSFDFTLYPRPANDDFSQGFAITDLNVPIGGDNYLATMEPGEPSHGGRAATAANSVWWTWTAPASGPVSLVVEGVGFEPLVAVYTGNTLSALTSITATADPRESGLTNRVSFMATDGVTYHIAVAGTDRGFGRVDRGLIKVFLQALSLRVAGLQRVLNSDKTVKFAAIVQVGNAGYVPSGALRLRTLARAGYSIISSQILSTNLPPDIAIGTTNLVAPPSLQPQAQETVVLSGTCPAPIVVDPVSFGIGWAVFVLLEEQMGTNWLLKDKELLLFGDWPVVGGFPGPGGGVIRFDPGFSNSFVLLTNLTILGPGSVPEGSSAPYYLQARFTDGSIAFATNAAWRASLFSIGTNGVFQAGALSSNQTITISAEVFYNTTNRAARSVTLQDLPPPVWIAVSSGQNHLFDGTLKGVPARIHIIESSTNISSAASWVPVATNQTDGSGLWRFLETQGGRARFYRARER